LLLGSCDQIVKTQKRDALLDKPDPIKESKTKANYKDNYGEAITPHKFCCTYKPKTSFDYQLTTGEFLEPCDFANLTIIKIKKIEKTQPNTATATILREPTAQIACIMPIKTLVYHGAKGKKK
jgi:hypothetical protein